MVTRGSAKRRGDGEDDGRYLARFNADRPGVYRLNVEARRGTTTLGQAAASLLVGGADVEMSDPRLNIQVLQRLAFASGGRMIANGGESALLDTLRARVPAARLAVTRDLWHNVWSFAAIAGLLGAEWILRRRWGLR